MVDKDKMFSNKENLESLQTTIKNLKKTNERLFEEINCSDRLIIQTYRGN